MKKTVGILLGLLLVAIGFTGAMTRQMNNTKTESRPEADSPVDIAKLCVSVSCGEYYGCGTIYSDDESSFTIVTARHILQDYYDGVSKDIEVTFENNESCSASIYKESEEIDVVFLSIDKCDVSEDYISVSDCFPGSEFTSDPNSSLTPGEIIYLVDANTDDIYAGSLASPSIYSEDFGMDMILCYCAVTPGMSGTGLFDEEGHYLGILLGGSDEAEAVCLDASRILYILKTI